MGLDKEYQGRIPLNALEQYPPSPFLSPPLPFLLPSHLPLLSSSSFKGSNPLIPFLFPALALLSLLSTPM